MLDALLQWLQSLPGHLLGLIVVDDMGHRLHWLYLTMFFVIAILIWLFSRPGKQGLLRFLFPDDVLRSRSTRVDIVIYLINGLLGGVVNLTTLLLSGALVADLVTSALAALSGTEGLGFSPNPIATLIASVGFLLLTDFGLYFAHYLQHKVPFFWNFHKVHHSAEVLNPVTAYRFHPVDVVLTGTVIAVFVGPLIGTYQFLYDRQLFAGNPALYGVVYIAFLMTANFRHSHIAIHYPASLSRWLVSPAMHQLHHSAETRHFDRNIGFIFAFWDRLFGTFCLPEREGKMRFGIGTSEGHRFQNVISCYLLPIRQSAGLCCQSLFRFVAALRELRRQ